MTADTLGDRMKSYENCYRLSIPRKSHVIIRVDGRAFHSINDLCKPFDDQLCAAMDNAARMTAREIQGSAYTDQRSSCCRPSSGIAMRSSASGLPTGGSIAACGSTRCCRQSARGWVRGGQGE